MRIGLGYRVCRLEEIVWHERLFVRFSFFFFREQFADSETRDRVTYVARKRRNRHNSDAETIKKKKRERVCRETRVDRVEQMCIIEDRSL